MRLLLQLLLQLLHPLQQWLLQLPLMFSFLLQLLLQLPLMFSFLLQLLLLQLPLMFSFLLQLLLQLQLLLHLNSLLSSHCSRTLECYCRFLMLACRCKLEASLDQYVAEFLLRLPARQHAGGLHGTQHLWSGARGGRGSATAHRATNCNACTGCTKERLGTAPAPQCAPTAMRRLWCATFCRQARHALDIALTEPTVLEPRDTAQDAIESRSQGSG